MPYSIWYIMFMHHQGNINKSNKLFQLNKSAMRMKINERNYCTGNYQNINIRYFFIKDRVDKGDLRIMYCTTQLILEDYFTKTLKGSLFNKFRDIIIVRVSP